MGERVKVQKIIILEKKTNMSLKMKFLRENVALIDSNIRQPLGHGLYQENAKT